MSKRKLKNDAELRRACEDLFYEYEMLRNTALELAAIMPELSRQNGDIILANTKERAYFESLLIHVRSLLHFAYPHNARDTDVIAQDYFDAAGQDWSTLVKTPPKLVEDTCSRISKLAAHLTYDRITMDPKWLYGDAMKIAVEAIRLFCKEVDSKLLDPRLPELAALIFEEVNKMPGTSFGIPII